MPPKRKTSQTHNVNQGKKPKKESNDKVEADDVVASGSGNTISPLASNRRRGLVIAAKESNNEESHQIGARGDEDKACAMDKVHPLCQYIDEREDPYTIAPDMETKAARAHEMRHLFAHSFRDAYTKDYTEEDASIEDLFPAWSLPSQESSIRDSQEPDENTDDSGPPSQRADVVDVDHPWALMSREGYESGLMWPSDGSTNLSY